ncbi:MAG: 30S ribosomal protein S1 [candidate division Zixibacteria bacterium 4484_93]|nr:MAG: 30S ribosomal protein S1 [candidate division Zixibacteria bacterium 4484_93]
MSVVEEFGDTKEAEEFVVPEEDVKRISDSIHEIRENNIVKGTVVGIGKDVVVVDINFKQDGFIPLGEFRDVPSVGDEVSVYIEKLEDANGELVLSKKKADFILLWDTIREAYETGDLVRGVCKRRIKGGIVVDLMGVDAFLPGSQIALRQVPDFDALIGQEMEFKVVKINKLRRNIVVSRRAVLEQERAEKRKELLSQIEVGGVYEGVVKNITDFGVFVDLGGLDGLLHITDMSWGRINHPSDLVSLGDTIKVKILDFDRERERISLGMKQLTPSPWEKIANKYPPGTRARGKVTNITKYGAFVELEEGVEGLIHISELSWTEHIDHPSQVLKVGDIIDVVVQDVDADNQKVSLSVRALEPDPWMVIEEKYKKGSRIKGVVRNITAFGAFVEIEKGIDGLVHISDLSWTRRIQHPSEILKRGQEVEVVVLEVDRKNKRISLGYKQLENDPWPTLSSKYPPGRETTGKIIRLSERGVIVELPDGVEGFVPVTQLGKEVNKPSDAFGVGDVLPMKVIEFDGRLHRIVLSVNAYFESKEKDELSRYLTRHAAKTLKVKDVLKGELPEAEETEKKPKKPKKEKDIPEDKSPEMKGKQEKPEKEEEK